MRDYDTWKTTPPEPDIVGKCAHCESELYNLCDYVHDRNNDEWFCDIECYVHERLAVGELVEEMIEPPERDDW